MSETENTKYKRVDTTPASFFMVVVFAIVFTVVYLFWPQISMLIPFTGMKQTHDMGYQQRSVEELCREADCVVVGKVEKIGPRKGDLNGGQAFSCADVTLSDLTFLKGTAVEPLTVVQYGGDVLLESGGSGKKKFNITYTDTAQFEKGTTYLLFLHDNGEVLEGKFGQLKKTGENTFQDASGKLYTLQEIKTLLGGTP